MSVLFPPDIQLLASNGVKILPGTSCHVGSKVIHFSLFEVLVSWPGDSRDTVVSLGSDRCAIVDECMVKCLLMPVDSTGRWVEPCAALDDALQKPTQQTNMLRFLAQKWYSKLHNSYIILHIDLKFSTNKVLGVCTRPVNFFWIFFIV